MNKITRFDEFLYEGSFFSSKDLFDELLSSKIPLSTLKELKSTLSKKHQVSEGLFNNFRLKFGNFLSNQCINYLLNNKQLTEKLKIINIFDPTDLSNIKKCENINFNDNDNWIKEQLNEKVILFNSSEVETIVEKYDIFNKCDTNIIKWDERKIESIKSDFQLSVNRNQSIFLWTNYDNLRTDTWISESVTKIVRSDEEMKLLINSIKKNK